MTTANRNQTARICRLRRTTTWLTLTEVPAILLCLVVPWKELGGQVSQVRPEIAAGGVISLWLRGFVGRIGLPIPITRHALLTPEIDFSRLHKGGCDLVDTPCLERPETESIGSAGVTLGIQAGSRSRPHLEAGGVVVHRFSPDLSNVERREFLAPVIEAGIRPPARWGRWSLSLRWRWIDPSREDGGFSEFALLLGFIPGKAR